MSNRTKSKKKSKSARKTVALRMGVPTIASRLDEIEANLLGAAGILGMGDELSELKPDVANVSISQSSSRLVCRMLGTIHEHLYWLQAVKEVANQLAPTADQRESFEKIRGIGGAR